MVVELYAGEEWVCQLSQTVSWEISYGSGNPTDAWSITAVAQEETMALLKQVSRAVLREDAEIRLRGIVDDVTVTLSQRGRLVTLTGRGMGGLLMDNEALPAIYLQTGLRDMLASYVTPYGIELEKGTEIPNLWYYTISAGDSCYGALAGYTRWAAGITPRFSPTGGLLLLPKGSGRDCTIDGTLPILEVTVGRKRYGVISEIVQVNTRTGGKTIYRNEAFAEGECRRVMTSSGSCYSASSKSPETRIEESSEELDTLTLTAAGLFLAQPDDIAAVSLPALGIDGSYLVTQATSSVSGKGSLCCLELRAWD